MTTQNSPEKMTPTHDFEAITSVPSAEIARWIARINLINFALAQNRFLDDGDIIGSMYHGLVQAAEEGGDWPTDPTFETATIYELKPSINFDKVMNGPTRYAHHPQYGEGKNVSLDIARAAVKAGLGRLGLYGATEPHVPPEATAALHYRRGNIKDPIDRKLYERSDEIDEATIALEYVVMPRYTASQVMRMTAEGWVRVDREEPVYAITYQGMDTEKAQDLGLDPASPIDPWWQELQHDLSRIDEASIEL